MFASLKIKLILALVLSSFAVGAFYYVKFLQSEVEAAKIREAQYKSVIVAKDAETAAIKADIAKIFEAQKQLNSKLLSAQAEVKTLEGRFSQTKTGEERDIGKLAVKKPEAIERAINGGTKEALRCNELVTGAEPTADELSGKTNNSLCPGVLEELRKGVAKK